MKYIFIIISTLFLLSCSSDEEVSTTKKTEVESLIEYKDGIYTEYYPGRKNIKIRGAQDVKKVRDGKWVLFSEEGEELSITYFEKGLREGHTIIKRPNGTLNYVGEYKNDQQIGVWKFYDESGNLKEEKDYGQPK